jgi:excisionase family DNA binding protein
MSADPVAPNAPSLLTMTEAAERLGTTHRFVRRLVAERRIAYLKLGRHVRISSEDLDRFLTDSRVEARSRSATWRDAGTPSAGKPVARLPR